MRRRRGRGATEATEELARLAGRRADVAVAQLVRAAEAFGEDRPRDAIRIVRPLASQYPQAAGVRELHGLALYRTGKYAAAAEELEAFAELTDSAEAHPVLMDCRRALGDHRSVERLWEELSSASPSAALVAEGRIVLAGSCADRGDLARAIGLLERRAATSPRKVQDHHLRLWYALGDLYDRAGDTPRARTMFTKVQQAEAGFADVAERLSTLR